MTTLISLFRIFVIMLLSFILSFSETEGQNPLIKQWDKRFGGMQDENFIKMIQTLDGGYLLGGSSNSGVSGDKSQPSWGMSDGWIIKFDSMGLKLWDKRFGGTNGDVLKPELQTNDGGYILGGGSYSGISGDKTQPSWGSVDIWIVRINSIGIKVWDKRFGSNGVDGYCCMDKTIDGGYIIGGSSYGGISGDKTQPSWGASDYWIVKTNSSGNKVWDMRFGGNNGEGLNSILQTSDGGYIMGGTSASDSSGDLSQATKGDDYWIIKIDSLGIKQWDKLYGGVGVDEFRSMSKTNDGGYILGGYTTSDSSGNKSQNTKDTSALNSYRGDYWIVKIDSGGNKQWDKDFGGLYIENEFGSVIQTLDGGYLLSGSSMSGQGADKTESNLGPSQAWVIKTDSLGNKEWDKTIHTTLGFVATPGYAYALQSADGCFLMYSSENSGIGGDKTQPNWNTSNTTLDFWIIKFCDSTLNIGINEWQYNEIKLEVYPNPVISNCTVYSPYAISSTLKVYDLCGRKVLQQAFNYQVTFSASFLSKGVYIIEVGDLKGRKGFAKLVKE